MYQAHFRLTAPPFSIAPDPRFLYMSERHREALAHLMYGLGGEGGFVLLTGEVGTGKTTVCRCLLEQVPDNCDVALIINPRLTAVEMLATICDEFHIAYREGISSPRVFVHLLNIFLLKGNADGRRAVLIVDEAQNLDPEVLEQLRLLTNLETNTRKLLQIVLLGQPELLTLLARPELRQVAQRVVARFHLTHLSQAETAAYVAHRLKVAGAQGELIPAALSGPLHRATGGIPRLINIVCDRALLGAYAEGRPQVTAAILAKAAGEVLGARPSRRGPWLLAGGLTVAALGLAGALYFGQTGVPPGKDAVLEVVPPSAQATAGEDGGGAPVPVAAAASVAKTAEMPAADPVTPEVVPDTLDWPTDQLAESAQTSAFSTLLARYGVDYKPLGAIPRCVHVESFGLHCLTTRGDLAALERFNQPAILQLRGRERSYPVVLEAIEGEAGQFSVGGQSRRVPLAEMTARWTGEYLVLWRPPPGYETAYLQGQRGPGIAWLRDALAAALGEPSPAGPRQAFDAALAVQVKAFQEREGLAKDGVVGPLTLIRLNLALDPRQPRLRVGQGEGREG